jgi:hypothetical protein
MFRGHSSSLWWTSQDFYYTYIERLHNQAPTFVLSIGCNTACYQELYEDYGIYGYYWMPGGLLSAFCKDRVGALGGIGAATVTRSRFNDILTWGFLDYIWPEFMSTLGSSTYPDFARPAYALVAGKLFLNQHAFIPGWWPSYITDTHNVFHYLGEAYLCLNTEVPQQMSHDFAAFQTHGQWQYEFTVEEGAVVCFSKDDEIIQPVYDNIFTLTREQREAQGINNLPENLKDATKEFKADPLMLKTLGEHTYNKYLEAKRLEWREYRTLITKWELDKYLIK